MNRTWTFAILALAAAAAMAALSPWASQSPDGLEKVATDHARADSGAATPAAPLNDYKVPGLAGWPWWERVLAGLIGVATVFVAALGVGRLIHRRGRHATGEDAPGGTPTSR